MSLFFIPSPFVQDASRKKHKEKKGTNGKATFKVARPKVGLKKGASPKDGSRTKYRDYDLVELKVPKAAYPDSAKENSGHHSYTLYSPSTSARIEVLLRHKAFFVKRCSDTADGPIGQVSWAKLGGPQAAWTEAVRRSGF